MIRIVLADDHALVRAGIRSLILTIENVEVVAETADGAGAVALVKEHRPDVVLMDIAMGTMNGLEATSVIKSLSPETKVLILSMYVNEAYVEQALRAGASGYLLKDSESNDIGLALNAVLRGDIYLCPRVSTQLVQSYLKLGSAPSVDTPAAAPTDDVQLSARQREVLRYIAQGFSTKEIAHQLGISHKTVEVYRAQVMHRLNIHDVPGLVRYSIRTGLISLCD